MTTHSGVLSSRMLASSRPSPSTRPCSLSACSRWWPGYVSCATVSSERRQPDREVEVDVDPGAIAAVVPVVAGPRLARAPGRPGGPRRAARRSAARRVPGTARRGSRRPPRPAPARRSTPRPRPRGVPRGRRCPGSAASSSRATASNRASGRRSGTIAKQRSTCSRYGRSSPARTRARVSSAPQLEVEPVAALGRRTPRRRARRAAPPRRPASRAGERSCSMSTRALRSAGP